MKSFQLCWETEDGRFLGYVTVKVQDGQREFHIPSAMNGDAFKKLRKKNRQKLNLSR